jgi:hypothetical protein
MLEPSDIAGIVGSGLIISTYAMSQAGRMDVRRPAYPALNALGASLVIFSLVFKFNFAALVVEGFWCVISVAGLVGSLRRRGGDQKPRDGSRDPASSSFSKIEP